MTTTKTADYVDIPKGNIFTLNERNFPQFIDDLRRKEGIKICHYECIAEKLVEEKMLYELQFIIRGPSFRLYIQKVTEIDTSKDRIAVKLEGNMNLTSQHSIEDILDTYTFDRTMWKKFKDYFRIAWDNMNAPPNY